MIETIQFGSKIIAFHLEFTDRKTLGITVTPDLEVFVKAPTDAPIDKVKERVKKKAPWIIKQQSFFLSFQPKLPARKFVSGESHLYLGRQYRLKVKTADNEVESEKWKVKSEGVKLKGQFLEVYTADATKVKALVEAWYLERARSVIQPMAQRLFEGFTLKNNLAHLTFNFSFRQMPTRWGSCTTRGKIILNPELIKAPKGCIEYVIIHELCHLIYHNHTQKFIDLQSKEMKAWEKWKMKLEQLLA
jgi:predicted metal-dependent hydrolase